MAGGQGTRFWPASRESQPKQFLKVTGTRTLLQETVARLRPLLQKEDVYVVCGPQYIAEVKRQLDSLEQDQIIVEPAPRNTAPCVGLAAVALRRRCGDEEVMAVLPSDHVIQNVPEFHDVLRAAGNLAREGWLVTFGIEPSYPATGYGYLMRGEALNPVEGRAAHRVGRFAEKPDAGRAEEFLKSGDYYWNSGMFVWSVGRILEEIRTHMPELGQTLQEIEKNWDQPDLWKKAFSSLERISIDYGVMEKSEKVAMLPCGLGWNDVGNWKALEEVGSRDEDGITANAEYLNIDSRRCVLYTSDNKFVALVGVEDLVVVETPDAILVCNRNHAEDVRKVVEKLKEKGSKKYL